MAQVTIDVPEQNLPLLLQITDSMGIKDKDVIIKNTSPDWHYPILKQRLEDFETGKSSATSWEDFVNELDREDDEDSL